MSILSWSYVVVASVCATFALLHILVATRLRERSVHVLFALTGLMAAVEAVVQRASTRVGSPEQMETLFDLSYVSICSFLILICWLVSVRTGAVRRSLLFLETGLLTAAAVMPWVLPQGAYSTMRVDAIGEIALPWGEVFTVAVGDPSPWRIVGDVANIGFMILLLDTTIRLVRQRASREAILIGGSLVVIALSVLVIIPVDLGLIVLPPLHPFAFLLIVAGMAWDLSDRVALASVLSEAVEKGERRWRQLTETAPVLMSIVDLEGRIVSVNAHYTEVSGRSAEDVVGRSFLDLIPEDTRQNANEAFAEVKQGRVQEVYETDLVTASGERRAVSWRNVLLHDSAGEIEGVLSIGADVTERRDAEQERDRALRELERSLANVEKMKVRLEEENLILKEAFADEDGDHRSIVGTSDPLKYVLHKVTRVATTGATVLLTGETGSGKELVAREVHRLSPRRRKAFVAVNCAALPPSLIESELFGHERGSFTGADRMRRGRFELADGGTLFLDEISELPLEMQPKLLRVLQEGTFERVGGDRAIEVDVRVIAASNRTLRDEVDKGRFREDLFYRLDVYPITIPPLRDRLDDLPALVEHFVRQIAERERIEVMEIPPEVLRHLGAYSWPGNIRELQNVIERAVLRCTDGVLRLTEALVDREPTAIASATGSPAYRPTLDELQRDYIIEVLGSCDGQVAGRGGAAQILGIHPNTLRSRMQKLGIRENEKPTRDSAASRRRGHDSSSRDLVP